MFNLGFGELAVILVILLLVVGPNRLPTLMKSTGKAMRTLRQASRDIQSSVGLDEMLREDALKPPPPRSAPAPAVGTQPRAGGGTHATGTAAPPESAGTAANASPERANPPGAPGALTAADRSRDGTA